jgi:hypothetical protein
MKTRNLSPVGSMHPILFFVFVYVVALLFSIFICSSLFYSCNVRSAKVRTEKTGPAQVAKVSSISNALQK